VHHTRSVTPHKTTVEPKNQFLAPCWELHSAARSLARREGDWLPVFASQAGHTRHSAFFEPPAARGGVVGVLCGAAKALLTTTMIAATTWPRGQK
jgi:hypothetical protein